jgi:hypothetical protein
MRGTTTDYRERPDSAGRREPGEEEREKVREREDGTPGLSQNQGTMVMIKIDRGAERARQVIGRGVVGPKISSFPWAFFVACRWLREGGEAAA